ncbi:amidase [Ornithinimicrobium sediminis]|uniref:amidase n=1 Tax=Ornithinimicrobium sediminis TaxID=2904603 RepID=UPI001E33BE65|nr:amidase [Ornithinimicrobium sediminis]MCE0486584.1 amidase [Ornithinimicrobium sediminis]
MSGPRGLSATELHDAYAAGTLDPVTACEDALAAVTEHDPVVNAVVSTEREAALAAAHASARRWQEGRPLGPADGVPTTVKDIFLTRDRPTLRGSLLVDAAGPWLEDAPAVARLREGGAVVIGRTTTPEFAWKGTTDSLRHGVTRNPWDPQLTPGGSSGGSAAAVALGMGAWSIGTDGGGSVRIPASFTGTVALKPTYGRIPLWPASPYGTLAHAGPMTRTVRDTAVLLDLVGVPDDRDWSHLAAVPGSTSATLDAGVAGLRVAWSPDLGWGGVAPEVRRLTTAAVDVLATLGAEVQEVRPPLGDLSVLEEAFHVLWFTGAAKVLRAYGEGALERVDPGLAEQVRRYAGATAQDYLDATAVRMELGRAMGQLHRSHDVLVCPTVPVAPFPADRSAPPGWPSDLWTSWTPFTYPFNMTQQPALSVPCGFTADGLPVGLQVVGPRHRDALVLRVGHAYEHATDWQTRRPPMAGAR